MEERDGTSPDCGVGNGELHEPFSQFDDICHFVEEVIVHYDSNDVA